MGYCPFQNYPDTTEIIQLSGDTTNGDAGFQTNLSFVTIPCPQSNTCQLWDNVNNRCGMVTSDYLSNISNPTSTVPTASTLISEYMGNEDMDGNDLIYGVDFYIIASERPPMLASLPTEGTEYTWQQYLDTL